MILVKRNDLNGWAEEENKGEMDRGRVDWDTFYKSLPKNLFILDENLFWQQFFYSFQSFKNLLFPISYFLLPFSILQAFPSNTFQDASGNRKEQIFLKLARSKRSAFHILNSILGGKLEPKCLKISQVGDITFGLLKSAIRANLKEECL